MNTVPPQFNRSNSSRKIMKVKKHSLTPKIFLQLELTSPSVIGRTFDPSTVSVLNDAEEPDDFVTHVRVEHCAGLLDEAPIRVEDTEESCDSASEKEQSLRKKRTTKTENDGVASPISIRGWGRHDHILEKEQHAQEQVSPPQIAVSAALHEAPPSMTSTVTGDSKNSSAQELSMISGEFDDVTSGGECGSIISDATTLLFCPITPGAASRRGSSGLSSIGSPGSLRRRTASVELTDGAVDVSQSKLDMFDLLDESELFSKKKKKKKGKKADRRGSSSSRRNSQRDIVVNILAHRPSSPLSQSNRSHKRSTAMANKTYPRRRSSISTSDVSGRRLSAGSSSLNSNGCDNYEHLFRKIDHKVSNHSCETADSSRRSSSTPATEKKSRKSKKSSKTTSDCLGSSTRSTRKKRSDEATTTLDVSLMKGAPKGSAFDDKSPKATRRYTTTVLSSTSRGLTTMEELRRLPREC